MKDLQKDTLSIALAQPPKGSWINMVGMVSKRSSGTIFNASYDVPNSAQKLFTRMLYWQNILQIVVIAVVLFMPWQKRQIRDILLGLI